MKQPHTVSCWKGGNSRPHLFHLKKPAVITKTTARGKKTIIYNNYIHVQHAFRRRAAHIVRHSAFTWGSAFLLPKSSKLIGTYWHILTLRTPYLGPDGPPNPLDQPLDPLHDPPLEPDLVGAEPDDPSSGRLPLPHPLSEFKGHLLSWSVRSSVMGVAMHPQVTGQ